ncbi:812_t:CDS:2 [Racocetra fulgida]|uniref:812_t:CDS:1 n=2 Tax=Racocetra TaxID=940663 RepID=A0A9N8YU50_9GLOM|nr:812_t:CDS:2 [Racocetra fulgida]
MREVKVGDTVFDLNNNASALAGYQEVKPTVYSNLYPSDSSHYKEFKKSLEELQIQDSSLSLEPIDSQLLGPGLRGGFLGLLHREIIKGRLEKEYDCEIIITPPSIDYQIILSSGETIEVNNPQKIPTKDKMKIIEELFINLNIATPEEQLGEISQLCQDKRGSLYQLNYHLPFAEFILDFHDKIKSISHGYASFDYQMIGFRPSDIVKIDILLNNQLIPDLSFLAHRSSAYGRAKTTCEQLKMTLNRQNFPVPIQAVDGNHVIARETLPALKKNVISRIHGGGALDRKMKLWAKQKKGKARMKEVGKVNFGAGNLRALLKNFKEGQDYSISPTDEPNIKTYNFHNDKLRSMFRDDRVPVRITQEAYDGKDYAYRGHFEEGKDYSYSHRHWYYGENYQGNRGTDVFGDDEHYREITPNSLACEMEHVSGDLVKNDNHSHLRKENHELRQQLAEVKQQLAEVLEELRKLRNNSSGSDSEKLEQQIIHNEKLIKNSEAVSVNEIKDQINKSQALMNEVSATGAPNKDDKVYHYQRQRLAKIYQKEFQAYASSYIRFGVGISVPQVHDFSDFLDTMAHELAHCLLGDFDFDLAADHEGGEHKQLTREIAEYLEKMPEVKELERLQRNFKKDCDEFIYVDKYLNLDRKDFCCEEMYENLLGEDNSGECELHFGYIPQFREYFIDIKDEYGGAVLLISYCPWCGKKLPKGLREEFFDILEKEYKIETDIGEYKERADIPQEFKSDEW